MSSGVGVVGKVRGEEAEGRRGKRGKEERRPEAQVLGLYTAVCKSHHRKGGLQRKKQETQLAQGLN